MKKVIVPFVALLVVAIALISWKSHSAAKFADGAVHIGPVGCTVLDGNGAVAFTDGSTLITPSDNAKFTCKASGVPNSTGKAVKYDNSNTGFLCFITGYGYTNDWKETVSASGQVTLQCFAH